MKTQKFVLVCVNEESDVVSVSLHKTAKDAQTQMAEEYKAEVEDLGAGGYFDEGDDEEDLGCYLGENSAVVGWGVLESCYKWSIETVEEED